MTDKVKPRVHAFFFFSVSIFKVLTARSWKKPATPYSSGGPQ